MSAPDVVLSDRLIQLGVHILTMDTNMVLCAGPLGPRALRVIADADYRIGVSVEGPLQLEVVKHA